MKLIKPSTEILDPFDYNQEDILKRIELIGRVCYKSEDKITEDSAEKFVKMLIKNGHESVLEHINFCVVFTVPNAFHSYILNDLHAMSQAGRGFESTWIHQMITDENQFTILFNARTLRDWLFNSTAPLTRNIASEIKKVCPLLLEDLLSHVDFSNHFSESIVNNLRLHQLPTRHPYYCTTVKFVVDRGVSHELVRHRINAISQESTRYCNYKGGITFIIPLWTNIRPGNYLDIEDYDEEHIEKATYAWVKDMINCEKLYKDMIDIHHWSPQQARSVLPNSLKTELYLTASRQQWEHIFYMRCAPGAHPQMKEVMIPLKEQFGF